MARKTPPPPEAISAVLAVVAAALRAEAAAERAGADPTQPTYTARARMARTLESLAERIAPAGAL